MLRDAQTHALPEVALERARVALGLDYADWPALRAQIDAVRARVTAEFEALLAPRRGTAAPDAIAAYWRALPDAGDAAVLEP